MVSAMRCAFLSDAAGMYPKGLAHERRQHRDMIRIYASGWLAAALAAGNRAMVLAVTPYCNKMRDPNWWPDDTWLWWNDPVAE